MHPLIENNREAIAVFTAGAPWKRSDQYSETTSMLGVAMWMSWSSSKRKLPAVAQTFWTSKSRWRLYSDVR
jgi:hypothetical protein